MTNSNIRQATRRVLVAQNVERRGWGGMARMMSSMHAALEPFGWETDYFTADDMEGVASARMRRHSFGWHVRTHARRAFLRGQAYDIINVHEPAGAAVVVGKAQLGSPAIVAMSHGIEQRYWDLRLRDDRGGPDPPSAKERVTFPLLSLWQSWLTLRRADHVFCMSTQDRAFLESRHHKSPRQITQVFPGAGPEFASVAPRRSYERPCTRVVFSGTWIERKGIRQTIEAFIVLARKYPELKLGILGAGLPVARVLASFPDDLQARIIVHPPLSHADCAEALLDYDIYLLPSFFEGTPLTLIEAMCTGMPSITATNSGMKDVIQDGENGMLVDAGDAGQIVRAMERMLTDACLRESLGRQGLADATTKYTWRALGEIVNEAYSGLLRL